MVQPEPFSVTAALSDVLDKSFGVTLQLTPTRGGDKQPRAASTPVAVLRYSNAIARDLARLGSKISLENEQSVDWSSTRKAKPKPKEGTSKSNPFVPTEADVDELSSEHLVDPYAQADLSWSDEAPRLKEIVHGHVEARARGPSLPALPGATRKTRDPKVTDAKPVASGAPPILSELRTLRLVEKGICTIDGGMQGLENLVELSLAGNEIDDDGAVGGRSAKSVEATTQVLSSKDKSKANPAVTKKAPPKDAEFRLPPLPLKLECLSFVANRLTRPPPLSHLVNLVHLGLAYNRISTLCHSTSSTPQTKATRCWVPPSLVSLDLSRNEITDVEQIRALAGTTARKSLRVLNLQANPVSLHPHLSRLISTWLPRVTHLNDVLVQKPDSTGGDGLDEVSMMKQDPTVTFSIPSCAILPPPPPLAPLISTSESKTGLSQTDKPPTPTNAALPPQPPDEICYSFRLSMFSGPLLERPRAVPEEFNVSNPSAVLPELVPLDDARELLDPEKARIGLVAWTPEAGRPGKVEVGWTWPCSAACSTEWRNGLEGSLYVHLLRHRATYSPRPPAPPGTASGSRPGSGSSKAGAQVKKKDASPKKTGKWTAEDVAAAYERTAVDEVEIARGVVSVADLLDGKDQIDADVPLEELYPGVSPYPTIDTPPPTSSSGGVSTTAAKKNPKQAPQPDPVEPPPKIPELGPSGKRVLTLVKVHVGLNVAARISVVEVVAREGGGDELKEEGSI